MGWEVKSLRAGTRAARRSLCGHPRRRDLPDRRAHLAAEFRINPCDHRSGAHAQAAAEPRRDRPAGRRGGTRRLHHRAAGAVLEAGRAKLRIGLAKGKKQHDKRATEKDRDWQRDKARVLRVR